jgi:hypothetical protein
MKSNQIDLMNQACAREAKEAERGRRDARQDIARIQVRRAAQAASPAGLVALFPGLKMGKK